MYPRAIPRMIMLAREKNMLLQFSDWFLLMLFYVFIEFISSLVWRYSTL